MSPWVSSILRCTTLRNGTTRKIGSDSYRVGPTEPPLLNLTIPAAFQATVERHPMDLALMSR